MTKAEPPLDLDPDASEVGADQIAMAWVKLIACAVVLIGAMAGLTWCARLAGWI